jgi:putative phosphoribosyl transferase
MKNLDINIEHPLVIPCGDKTLDGLLQVPKDSQGIILFVHGSGSSRFSVRNQFVARHFNEAKFATLLFDLLMPEEEVEDVKTLKYRFDIDFLSSRLLIVTDWIVTQQIAHGLPIGYFGASTGGGAALVAASKRPNLVKAIVSRGGRPDLAMEFLDDIKAPVLLIVGENDVPVIELNEKALQKLQGIRRMEIVPGASHLFEEAGTLQAVANLARKWFREYLIL